MRLCRHLYWLIWLERGANGDGISNHHLESTYPVSGSIWCVEALPDTTPSTFCLQDCNSTSSFNWQTTSVGWWGWMLAWFGWCLTDNNTLSNGIDCHWEGMFYGDFCCHAFKRHTKGLETQYSSFSHDSSGHLMWKAVCKWCSSCCLRLRTNENAVFRHQFCYIIYQSYEWILHEMLFGNMNP